ncbi:type II secretion system minor pseudopilin GspK [Exilibacterium tricleocarpae]|uniref:type II secretion system minor pseudopilin GspK n=1 Tax=Exilibacterium tricleocarpae TaxID=2591008 RepID=UPI0015D2CE2D|nr:type II secretion system minor pseudopilin GspK [Exilibacterium tricleocarpae]
MQPSFRRPFRRQTGAALIIALLIVATVVGLAVGIAAEFQLTAARAENRWHGAQAREYLFGSESLAAYALAQDEDMDVDHLAEAWAMDLPQFPVEGGWVEPRLIDAQGRLNINSLVGRASDPGGGASAEPWQRFTPAQRRFMRLLQTYDEFPVDQTLAQEITVAVIDWLDADDQPFDFSGAESDYYRGLEIPYRPANQPMNSISELLLVRHMPIELYNLVKYELVALPEATDINVNTASARLMSTLNIRSELTPLTLIDGESMVAGRGDEGYGNVREFTTSETVTSIQSQEERDQISSEGLTVKSSHFMLLGKTQIGRQRRHITSLLKRDGEGQTSVVWRRDNRLPVYPQLEPEDEEEGADELAGATSR